MNAQEISSINRANAAHSTGPKTPEGKQRASMNALKHGLTGQRLILQPEEHEAYHRLSKSLYAELRPRTTMERQLVQKIIDCHTRLNRVAVLDTNMLNFGLTENLSDAPHPDEMETARAQVRSWMAQQMSFERLGRYEARLSRELIAYSKELDRLQNVRIRKEQDREHSLTSRASRFSALRVAGPAIAGKGQDLSPQTSTAQPSQWSSASFGSEPPVAGLARPGALAPDPKPLAA